MSDGRFSTRREVIGASGFGAAAIALSLAPAALASGSQGTQTGGQGIYAEPSGPPVPPADRLRRLLRVELLLLYCYEEVSRTRFASPRTRAVLARQARHEQAHVDALAAELRRLAPSTALPTRPADVAAANRALAHRNVTGRLGQLQGEKDALNLLLALERVVGGAYFVALITLRSKRLIDLAVSIMAAEAQHEALLGDLLYPGHPDQSVPYGLIQGTQ